MTPSPQRRQTRSRLKLTLMQLGSGILELRNTDYKWTLLSFLPQALFALIHRITMPHTDEAAEWFTSVYEAIQQIPYGKCTSYGHIALLLGYPKRARQVGVCLKHLPNYDENDPEKYEYHSGNVPWQRVVNSKGGISSRGDGGSAANRQAERLRAEGVEVEDGRGAEEATVDFSRFGWFPEELPLEPGDES